MSILRSIVTGAAVALATPALVAPAFAQDGELRIVLPSLWNEALDPMLGSGSSAIGLTAIYDDLIGAKADGSGLSKDRGIAEDWTVSEDGMVVTLKIREGIQFHRGYGELTADDVVFSLERLKSERGITQFKAYFQNRVASIEAPDPRTVVVTGNEPIPDFLTVVSPLAGSPERFMVSKKAVEELGDDGFAKEPVGSGAYEFVRLVGGQSLELKAVEDHWRLGTPRFETATFLAIPEEETSIAMLLKGDADLAPLSRANVSRMSDEGVAIVSQEGASAINIYMEDQYIDGVSVQNEQIREALNLAIDRQLIVDALFEGQGRPVGSYYTQTRILDGIGYNWEEDLYEYDPERAKALIQEAGMTGEITLDMYIYPWIGLPEGPQTMQAISGMWNEVGVETNLIPVEYGVVRSRMLKGEIPGAIGYFPAPGRPWQGVLNSYGTFMNSKGSFSHVSYPELDEMLNTAANAVDQDVAQAELKDAIKFVRDNHLAVPVLEYDTVYAVSDKIEAWDPGFLPYNLNLDNLFAPASN